ncbi:MAG: hypothetical protein FJ319_01000 [SAR202 cluster bacterium]|nr:hypothetical protein [SAR202 cluster bacterium]
MRLILAGCEYSGTTTLAYRLRDWIHTVIGGNVNRIHDHFKIPYTFVHMPEYTPTPDATPDEVKSFLSLSPRIMDTVMRHNCVYHSKAIKGMEDKIIIGMHIDELVYGPRYFNYGQAGTNGDRRAFGLGIERTVLAEAPDTILVHVHATPDVIAKRMRQNPHPNGLVKENDIQFVLGRFAEEVGHSVLRRKIALDTSTMSVEETLNEFVRKVEPLMADNDRRRMLLRQVWLKDGAAAGK